MTVTWQWAHVLMWTIGLIEIGVLMGIPVGYWVARQPVPDRRDPKHAATRAPDEAPTAGPEQPRP